MFDITVYASPFPRTRFSTHREVNVRIGDVFVLKSEMPTGRFLVLIESVTPAAHDGSQVSVGELTFLASLDENDKLSPAPPRPPHFSGEAMTVPADVAEQFFSHAGVENDPGSGQDIQPSTLHIGQLLANRSIAVGFSAAGFNRHTLMVAQSGSGKSYALGVILEELMARTTLRLCVVDPNGDYSAAFSGPKLETAHSGLVVAASRDPSAYEDAITNTLSTERGCVLDLNVLDRPLWDSIVYSLLDSLWRGRAERRPTLIVLDEAHNLIPSEGAISPTAALALRIAAEGRKFGIWLLVASQRAQKLHADVISQCDNLIVMRMTNNNDIEHVAAGFATASREMIGLSRGFAKGTALAVGRVVRCPTLFSFRRRITREGGGDIGLGWSTDRSGK